MTGKEVNMVLQALGWKPDPGVKLTLLKKRSVLVELLEKLPVVNEADIQIWIQDGAVCCFYSLFS